MERQVRINKDVTGHNICYELRHFEILNSEHLALLDQLDKRKLPTLVDPHFAN